MVTIVLATGSAEARPGNERATQAEPVIPEPPRRGEPGGDECGPCRRDEYAIWSDANWALHNPAQTGLLGTVWMSSRVHVDSLADLPPDCASTFGVVAGKVERAVLSLGGIGRVHPYRWGDGGAHFRFGFRLVRVRRAVKR
jgi:hypothetical protein